MNKLDELKQNAIWVAKTLFYKGLVTGSTGNLSFIYNNKMYITQSGGCFGRIDDDSFSIVDLTGNVIEGKPSKEYPLHLSLYNKNKDVNAIIHTHSLYSTLVASLKNMNYEKLCNVTPYLEMLTDGNFGVVDYAKPGTESLFKQFNEVSNENTKVYFMKNHGITIGAKDIYTAFNILEEVEISSKIHIKISNYKADDFELIK